MTFRRGLAPLQPDSTDAQRFREPSKAVLSGSLVLWTARLEGAGGALGAGSRCCPARRKLEANWNQLHSSYFKKKSYK